MSRASVYASRPAEASLPSPTSSPPQFVSAMPSASLPSLVSPPVATTSAILNLPVRPPTPSSETSGASSLLAILSQFFESGSIVLRQLRRMEIDFHDMPSVFQGVRTRFPLMLDLVKKIMLQLDAGMVSESTQDVMIPVARSCVKHAQMMSDLVNQSAVVQAPPTNSAGRESTWPRDRRSAIHGAIEPEVVRIDAVLKANFDVLAQAGTFQTSRSSATSTFNMGGATFLQSDFYSPSPMTGAMRSATFHGALERRPTFRPSTPGSAAPVPAMPVLPSSFPPTPLSSVPTLSSQSQHRDSLSMSICDHHPSTPSNTVFMVPFPRDFNFVGRHDIIRMIDEKFMEQSCVALTGLGGIGKTQIVIEYAYIFRERNPKAHVFWVYGNTSARFEESYEKIARRLQLPGWNERNVDKLQLVYDWFNNDGNGDDFDEEDDSAHWLFILDNADDASTFYPTRGSSDKDSGTPKTYAKYLPVNSAGAVLLTTRDRRVGERLSGRTRALEVGSMTSQEARELLMSKVAEGNWDEGDGLRICEELFFLPLAITQAAAFISENNITVSEYLEMLFAGDEDIKDLLSEHLEDSRREFDTENSVMRTWKLSFDQISRGMPRAAEILSLLAVLDYHNVHQSLLRKDKDSEFGFKSGLGTLQAFHLITVGRGKDGVCKMHRLVALSTQKWLEVRGNLDEWRSEALSVIESKFPGPGEQSFSDWPMYESLTPHARLIFSYQFTKPEDLLKKARLLVAVTLYNLSKRRYIEAYNMSSKALEIRQRLLPLDDPITLDSVQTVGECLLHRGELQLARTMLERAVAGREKSLGPEEPDTLESLSDLTITLLELGDNAAAETTGMKALNGRQKMLGPEHPDTLVSQNIIAIVLHRQGKLEEARKLGEEVLARREALLGEEDPDTIMTRNNMSRLYLDLGEYDKAGSLIERVIDEEDKILGAEGCDIQVTMSNAALLKIHNGDFAEAERLLKKVLNMRERLLGIEHPSTLWSLEMLADVAQRAGRAEDASKWRKMVVNRTKPRVEELGELIKAGLLFD